MCSEWIETLKFLKYLKKNYFFSLNQNSDANFSFNYGPVLCKNAYIFVHKNSFKIFSDF